MIRSLHHMAFRCRDSEATRAFYEDVIGLTLAAAFTVDVTASGRPVRALHSFFRMLDGSYVAFFEVPGQPFDFKVQHDFDLHIALETSDADLRRAVAAAGARGIEVRGPADHGFVRSTYFRDPDGYVVELAVRAAAHDDMLRQAAGSARLTLDRWCGSAGARTIPR